MLEIYNRPHTQRLGVNHHAYGSAQKYLHMPKHLHDQA